MPVSPSPAFPFVIFFELVLLFAGCLLLWRHGLSRAGRTRTQASAAAMPAWDITLPGFMLFLWLIICGGLLGQSGVALLCKTSAMDETRGLLFNGGAFHGGMLLGVLLFNLLFARNSTRAGSTLSLGRKMKSGVSTLLIALPVLTVVGLAWQFLLSSCGVTLEEQDLIAIFANTESPLLLTLMILLAVVVAPVTEELIFRAGIFRYVRTRIPRWAALLVPALLFAALHANLASFVPLAALGMIFALAYERTGSIAVPIIAHGLFNFNTIILILSGVGL